MVVPKLECTLPPLGKMLSDYEFGAQRQNIWWKIHIIMHIFYVNLAFKSIEYLVLFDLFMASTLKQHFYTTSMLPIRFSCQFQLMLMIHFSKYWIWSCVLQKYWRWRHYYVESSCFLKKHSFKLTTVAL